MLNLEIDNSRLELPKLPKLQPPGIEDEYRIVDINELTDDDYEKQRLLTTISNLLDMEDADVRKNISINVDYKRLIIQCNRKPSVYKKILRFLAQLALDSPFKILGMAYIAIQWL
jgi:hypothetical protein